MENVSEQFRLDKGKGSSKKHHGLRLVTPHKTECFVAGYRRDIKRTSNADEKLTKLNGKLLH